MQVNHKHLTLKERLAPVVERGEDLLWGQGFVGLSLAQLNVQ